jgi:hypothetical protein
MPSSVDHACATPVATDDSSRTSSSMPTAPSRSAATERARAGSPGQCDPRSGRGQGAAIANPSPLVPPVTSTFIGIPRSHEPPARTRRLWSSVASRWS